MTNTLIDALYVISTAMLVPVMVALMILLGWTLMEVGGFLREFHERWRRMPSWRRFLRCLQEEDDPSEPSIAGEFFEQSGYPGLLGSFAARGRGVSHHSLNLSQVMSELEVEAAGRLARMRLGVRVGPMLGLMGTLIPLGPALIGLTEGDLDAMAGNLVVAFSTTVIGLLVGGICFTMSLARRQWYSRDAANIEYIYQHLVAAGDSDETAQPSWIRA